MKIVAKDFLGFMAADYIARHLISSTNMEQGFLRDRRIIAGLGAAIITVALIYLARQNLTYVHIDAIAHVNKARGLWDNTTPGLKQLGSIWLPLQHILI